MSPRNRLDPYREKRAPERTTEPFGGERPGDPGGPLLFVVQKHAARHLHYDLRLEIGGTLRSWALPKPVSFDPADKRAAFATEDHPLEYADFEGLIPAGEYGAGAVIVWDRGRFLPLEDPAVGFEHGKLLFELRGYKLRGLWTLVRTKRNAKEWLLIKKPPGWPRANGYPEVAEPVMAAMAAMAAIPEESILSGLTVEELRDGAGRGEEIRREPAALGAPRRPVAAAAVEVMLPEGRARPFSRRGWIFELKYEGYRAIAGREEGQPRLLWKSGRDGVPAFPELARALAGLPFGRVVIDGEVVVLDEAGRPDFRALQRRGHLTRKPESERAAIAAPATLVAFDLLGLEDFDLRPLPLASRKELLARILPRAGPLRYADHVEERGEDLFREVARHGLEGMVGKRLDSRYRGGRSGDWLKVRADREAGDHAGGGSSPWEGEGWGRGRPGGGGPDQRERSEPPASPAARRAGRSSPAFSNLDKVFWPTEGYTKGDLLAYYRAVSPWLLPYLRDRPLVIDRYPDGIEGKSFFQKHAAGVLAAAGGAVGQEGAVRTVPIWVDGSTREIDALVCDDAEALLQVINLGAIPLHIGASRAATLDRPDWAVLDLDPKGAPFAHVVEIALAARALCRELALPCFVKTSGGSGLHLLIPLGRRLPHEAARQLAELLARVLVGELPGIATIARAITARGGRVYIDYLQNGRGKLIAAPFSVRPLPGAPVSTPLRWEEVGPGLDVKAFDLRTVPKRLARQKKDPLAPVLDLAPDLPAALARLAARGSGGLTAG